MTLDRNVWKITWESAETERKGEEEKSLLGACGRVGPLKTKLFQIQFCIFFTPSDGG